MTGIEGFGLSVETVGWEMSVPPLNPSETAEA